MKINIVIDFLDVAQDECEFTFSVPDNPRFLLTKVKGKNISDLSKHLQDYTSYMLRVLAGNRH